MWSKPEDFITLSMLAILQLQIGVAVFIDLREHASVVYRYKRNSAGMNLIFLCILKPPNNRKTVFSTIFFILFWWIMYYIINRKMNEQNIYGV